MNVHLVDGTYELFRHYFAIPGHRNAHGEEVAAVRGVVGSMISMFEQGASHLAVATDHVVESFRNELWEDYKDSSGIDAELLAQFEPLEDALRGLGVTVWAMTEYEADDALAAGAEMAAADPRVDRVYICSPDKDLAQCVRDDRVVLLDRRRDRVTDRAGVIERFGVPPESIPDYLALVGDSADGFPGVRGFGAKTAATVLARYGHIEAIPDDPADWDVDVRGVDRLATTLAEARDRARLFLRLATLVTDAPVGGSVDELEWRGPTAGFGAICDRLDAPELADRARTIVDARR